MCHKSPPPSISLCLPLPSFFPPSRSLSLFLFPPPSSYQPGYRGGRTAWKIVPRHKKAFPASAVIRTREKCSLESVDSPSNKKQRRVAHPGSWRTAWVLPWKVWYNGMTLDSGGTEPWLWSLASLAFNPSSIKRRKDSPPLKAVARYLHELLLAVQMSLPYHSTAAGWKARVGFWSCPESGGSIIVQFQFC